MCVYHGFQASIQQLYTLGLNTRVWK